LPWSHDSVGRSPPQLIATGGTDDATDGIAKLGTRGDLISARMPDGRVNGSICADHRAASTVRGSIEVHHAIRRALMTRVQPTNPIARAVAHDVPR
jgi:hypothetical protein